MSNAFIEAPQALQDIIENIRESEYATLTRAGVPISNPLFHYYDPGDSTIDIATGLAYPAKADRVRHNPRIGLLLGPSVHAHDPIAMMEQGAPESRDLDGAPVVAIAAMGAVRDSDLQANTDKYVDLFLAEHPAIGPADWDTMKLMTNYWVRIWVECTPVRVYWWPDGRLNEKAPQVWEAPASANYAASDSAPTGPVTPRAKWPAEPWQQRAAAVLEKFPEPILTSLTDDGYPLPVPTVGASLVGEGFDLDIPTHSPCPRRGNACLSFGALATFTGQLKDGLFIVERLIGSLPSIFQNEGDEFDAMAARQQAELARRGQVMPQIRKGIYLA